MMPLFSKSLSRALTQMFLGAMLGFYPSVSLADTNSATTQQRLFQETIVNPQKMDLLNPENGVAPIAPKGTISKPILHMDSVTPKYVFKTDRNALGMRGALPESSPQISNALADQGHDFNYNFENGLPLHPYLAGSSGGATPDYTSPPTASALALQNNGTDPLFRIGGGAAYHLDEKWNLSLDYQAGTTGSNDQVFTGRGQQPIDLQVLNMGMHYQF